jgi:hypothetical protein
VRLNPVAERRLIGEDLHPSCARVSHPGSALRKSGIIHSHRRERNSPPVGNGTCLDYREACAEMLGAAEVLGAAEGVADPVAGTVAAFVAVAVAVGAPSDPQALSTSKQLAANAILMARLMLSPCGSITLLGAPWGKSRSTPMGVVYGS